MSEVARVQKEIGKIDLKAEEHQQLQKTSKKIFTTSSVVLGAGWLISLAAVGGWISGVVGVLLALVLIFGVVVKASLDFGAATIDRERKELALELNDLYLKGEL